MSDIRQLLSSTIVTDFMTHFNNKICGTGFMSILNEYRLFSPKTPGGSSDAISPINTALNSAKTRIEGLCCLHHMLRDCDSETFTQNALTWAKLLLQILQSPGAELSLELCMLVMGGLLEHAASFSDLSRELASSVVPGLMPALLAAPPECAAAVIQCLCKCLQHFGGPCGPYRNKIEQYLLQYLSGDTPTELAEAACRCLPLLARCGGGGGQGIKHTGAWILLVDKVLGSLHATLDILFQDLETEAQDVGRPEASLQLPLVDSEEPARTAALKARYEVLCSALSCLLSTEFPAVAKVPIEDILQEVCRATAITPKFLVARPTRERVMLSAVVPALHRAAFRSLSSLILCARSHLVPYSGTVNKLFTQTLAWSTTKEVAYGTTKPYGGLRRQVYQTLVVWLQALGASSGLEDVVDDLIHYAVLDCTPQVDAVKIGMPHGSGGLEQLEHMWSKRAKKKHKHDAGTGGATGSTQQLTGQRKVDLVANAQLTTEALTALKQTLVAVGVFISSDEHKSIQELIVPLLVEISQHPTVFPIPYNDPLCRQALYRLLLACVLSPNPRWPPPTQCALNIFSAGQQDTSIKVSSVCQEALVICEHVVHPRAPMLQCPLESDVIPQMTSLRKGNAGDIVVGVHEVHPGATAATGASSTAAATSATAAESSAAALGASMDLSRMQPEIVGVATQSDIEHTMKYLSAGIEAARTRQDLPRNVITSVSDGSDGSSSVVELSSPENVSSGEEDDEEDSYFSDEDAEHSSDVIEVDSDDSNNEEIAKENEEEPPSSKASEATEEEGPKDDKEKVLPSGIPEVSDSVPPGGSSAPSDPSDANDTKASQEAAAEEVCSSKSKNQSEEEGTSEKEDENEAENSRKGETESTGELPAAGQKRKPEEGDDGGNKSPKIPKQDLVAGLMLEAFVDAEPDSE